MRSDCYDVFFFQAEDGIRDLVRSRGLGDVYKRQGEAHHADFGRVDFPFGGALANNLDGAASIGADLVLSLIHI